MGIPYGATARSAALIALFSFTAVYGQSCVTQTGQCGPFTTCADIGFPGLCCSQYGWCGSDATYCGACCQNGPCTSPPSSPPPPPSPPSPPSPSYSAAHGEDSRLIAYVGNWQTCPTINQYDAYSHIIIAFAVSYTWSPTKNVCDTQCNVAPALAICNNANNQGLVNTLRAAGKKVILSFGGAGMGGSWAGDQNNCWDYCFGKEEQIATSLVTIVNNQQLDGVDIDYEYCYDAESGGAQAGQCPQRAAGVYSDVKAQTFLSTLTSKLRVKLDALNRGRLIVTHAPMDVDLTPATSKYFQILKARRADLDFLMPQFYNGVTRPVTDGMGGTAPSGRISAAVMFASLANDLFNQEPNKVVFGFCISDCGATGSNANAAQAVQVMSDLKTYNSAAFACNGGAFFWVALDDTSGSWSDAVVAEVSTTAGCSNPTIPTSSPTTRAPSTSTPTSLPTTTSPTPISYTAIPTSSPTTSAPSTSKPTSLPTSLPTTNSPTTRIPTTNRPTSMPSTSKPTSKPVTAMPIVNPWYPDWERTNTCAQDGLQPSWMTSAYFYASRESCCSAYFSWQASCLPAAPPPSPTTTTGTWYPDWERTGTCVQDGLQPSWMSGAYFFSSRESCCSAYFSWQASCLSAPPPPSPPVAPPPSPPVAPPPPTPTFTPGSWYPDWERTNTCAQDGLQPSWMTSAYSFATLESCCLAHFSWQASCLSAPPPPSPPVAPPPPTPTFTPGSWYPDWERTGTCAQDGLQPSWMTSAYSFATLESCCSAYFSWQENCSPPTQGLYPWYPDWERTQTCVNDGLQPNWMGGAYFFTSKANCCSAYFLWDSTCK